MREIMMEAGFPEDAVEDLLEKAEKLKENGKWETLMALAEETMDAYPGKNLLDEKLEKSGSYGRENRNFPLHAGYAHAFAVLESSEKTI